ncbi:hypothetical protein K440DRAFT_473237, partial [Wilcoxina mikolae CBS 423.85]
ILRQAAEYIIGNALGVFLWVRLVKDELLDYALEGCTKDAIFHFLKSLPTELNELHKHILHKLERGKEQDVRHGIKMFRLVLFAHRPLTVPELHHALAI